MSSKSPVHLVVLCHGLWGEPKHLNTLETLLQRSFGQRATVTRPSKLRREHEQQQEGQQSGGSSDNSSADEEAQVEEELAKAAPADKKKEMARARKKALLDEYAAAPRTGVDMDVVILNTSSNEGGKTYDGIDWLAERAVKEIREAEEKLKQQGKYLARYSMIGYSLGGLVARCVVGLLESKGFFANVQARQIITVATPHIGSPPGSGTFGRLVSYIGARLLSRTGEQLYSADEGWEMAGDTEKVGLLECMARPGSIFIRGLRRFEKVHFYANAVNDITVPFRTACIEEWDPFFECVDRVDVKVMADAPIITSMQIGEERPKTLSDYIPSVPAFFNPHRLPFGFPYNYIVVIGSPVLIPVFTVRVLLRLSGDNKKSRIRIADLERGWEVEQTDKESRIDRLMKSMVLGGEEQTGTAELTPGTVDSAVAVAPWHSPWKYDPDRPTPKDQPALLPAQRTMVRNLNNVEILPRLTKVWAYFPDVTNAHAIIVARTLSVEPHKRGLPIIKHLVDDFLA